MRAERLPCVPGQIGLRAMLTFNVVKEKHGWAIRVGERMTTHFRSRDLAIREANCLADAISRHGECTEVIVEGAERRYQADATDLRFRPDRPFRRISWHAGGFGAPLSQGG